MDATLALPGFEDAEAAASAPVEIARVIVDVDLPHLDHPLDYVLEGEAAEKADVGSLVRVRLAGTLHDGWVRERVRLVPDRTLRPVTQVVSAVPVVTEGVFRAARHVADRQVATLSQSLSLAVPPRHARTEKAFLARAEAGAEPVLVGRWARGGASGAECAGGADEGTGARSAPARGGGDASAPLPAEGGDRAGGEEPTPARHGGETHAQAAEGAGAACPPDTTRSTPVDARAWVSHPGGDALLTRLSRGESPRAVWSPLPPTRDAQLLALVSAVRASGRSTVVVVPTARQAARLHDLLVAELGADGIGLAGAELTPADRWLAHLRALHGCVDVVVGTRSAAWSPVRDLGLIVVWDDGDDRLLEQRAPRVDALDVAVARAHVEDAALVVGGWARSVKAQHLVATGWAASLDADWPYRRAATPLIRVLDPEDGREGPAAHAHVPPAVGRLLRDHLAAGPVLVQVPHAGWTPVIACRRCRHVARCPHCSGTLAQDERGLIRCTWCGRSLTDWHCPQCAGREVRALRVGSSRTADELGRAHPGALVTVSSAERGIVDDVDARPRLVVATPGAEPVAEGGYRGVVILEAPATAGRPELWATQEACRRWMNALALAAPGAPALISGGVEPLLAQTLVRWDPVLLADRLLAERRELRFFPADTLVALDGPDREVADLLAAVDVTGVGAEEIGTVPRPSSPRPAGAGRGGDTGGRAGEARTGSGSGGSPVATTPDAGVEVRALVRAGRGRGADLLAALKTAQQARSSRKLPVVRVTVNPPELF